MSSWDEAPGTTKITPENSQSTLDEERRQLFAYDQERRVKILMNALEGKVKEAEVRRYLTEVNDPEILKLVKEKNKIFAEILFHVTESDDMSEEIGRKIMDLRNARSGTYVHVSEEFTEHDIRNAIAAFRSAFLLVRYLGNKENAEALGRQIFIHAVMFEIVHSKVQIPPEYHFFFEPQDLEEIIKINAQVDRMFSGGDGDSMMRNLMQEKDEKQTGSHPQIAKRAVGSFLDELRVGVEKYQQQGQKELDLLVERFPDLNLLADKILEISN